MYAGRLPLKIQSFKDIVNETLKVGVRYAYIAVSGKYISMLECTQGFRHFNEVRLIDDL